MDTIDTTIKEQFKQLPSELQDFISASDFRGKIKSILEGQHLNQVQYDAFENEVMLVLLRLEDINSFTANVRHNVQVSRERAEKLSRTTMQQIFMPVTEMLKYQEAQSQNLAESGVVQNNNDNSVDRRSDSSLQDNSQYSNSQENNMFHKKLTQQVHIPKEEEKINLEEKETDEKLKQDTPPSDPYREPIE